MAVAVVLEDQHPGVGGNGTASTGGGGGGTICCYIWTGYRGGHGGSGIVALRYKIGEVAGTAKATGGNISFYNSKVPSIPLPMVEYFKEQHIVIY